MSQFSRIVARNSAFGLAAQIVVKVLSFGFSVFIVRELGADAFGQYSGVVAFGGIFVFLADLGLAPYAVREIARMRDQPDGMHQVSQLYGNLLALRMVLAILTALVIVLFAILTQRPWAMIGAIAINGISLFLYGIQGSGNAILSGFERQDRVAGAAALNQLVFVVLGGVALWLGLGYYGLVLAALVGVALTAVYFWQSVRSLGIKPDRAMVQSWIPILRASLPFGVIALALGLSYKFDSFLLNLTRGDAETGYYNAAYNLVFSAVILSNVFNTSLYPSLTRQAAATPQRLPAIYKRALLYLILVSFPIAIGIFALADQIVLFLYEAAYLPSIPALQIIIWVVPLMYLSEFLGYVILILDRERQAVRALLISTAINVILNLILIPRYGFLAAAVMTVVTEIVLAAQYFWLLRHEIRLLDSEFLVRPVLAAILMGIVVYSLHDMLFIFNVVIGAGVYVLLLIVFKVIGSREVNFVMNLRKPQKGWSPE